MYSAAGRTFRARFYLDEDVPNGAAAVGGALGLDIVAARDAHPTLPQDDPVHLMRAGADGRIMVTYDRIPRDPARVAHALERWVARRKQERCWPMQPFEVAFLSD